MNYIIILLQCIVAFSILNVWLLQNKKPSQWRGGNAKTIVEEFKVYGLPDWSFYIIGSVKVFLAFGLLAAIWFPIIRTPSALGLSLLLVGSIAMHVKISDPIKKSLPAFILMTLCFIIAFYSQILS